MTGPPPPPPPWPPGGQYPSQHPGQYPGWGGPGWSGYGEAPPTHQPPKPNKTPWILAALAGVVIIALVAGGLVWKFTSGDDDTDAAGTTTSASAAPDTPGAQAPTTTAKPACEGRVAARTPDTPPQWIPVESPRGLNYAVPPDWTVNSCTSLVGWEKPCPEGPFGFCPVRSMSGSAMLPNKQCPDHARVLTGVPGASKTDDIDEAVQLESQLVDDIFTSKNGVVPQVSLSDPREFTIDGQPAVQIVATVTGIEADDCVAPEALHSMVATKVDGQPGSVMFIVSMEQGFPGAPSPSLIDEILDTVHHAN
ncbi:hypothetical protein [Mycolicibacterium smegmatis]|uniref:DUF8017 domain-containing protein n=1 Tax=Mycolicibacterium smegmatis (strain MKD8) TaxID=1214915 RepID=A0A2U9PH44_MYCSE|nr:hypothetical protein [Mycolicibacterium smegmatis]AWT51039.1 hypothetical protein D806_000450 [Mycolicibacterium smegmatis MKD8]